MVAHTYISLPPIIDKWFQFLFHSPLGVLFTFPSRYSFTIGHQVVFSLIRWSGQIPTEFLVLCGTRVYKLLLYLIFRLQGCHFLRLSLPEHSARISKIAIRRLYSSGVRIPQPQYHNAHRLSRDTGLGSSHFAHHY